MPGFSAYQPPPSQFQPSYPFFQERGPASQEISQYETITMAPSLQKWSVDELRLADQYPTESAYNVLSTSAPNPPFFLKNSAFSSTFPPPSNTTPGLFSTSQPAAPVAPSTAGIFTHVPAKTGVTTTFGPSNLASNQSKQSPFANTAPNSITSSQLSPWPAAPTGPSVFATAKPAPNWGPQQVQQPAKQAPAKSSSSFANCGPQLSCWGPADKSTAQQPQPNVSSGGLFSNAPTGGLFKNNATNDAFPKGGSLFANPAKVVCPNTSLRRRKLTTLGAKIVTFRLEDGTSTFSVHHSLLKQYWPSFATLPFDVQSAQDKHCLEYTVPDVSCDIFSSVVHWLYTGCLEMNEPPQYLFPSLTNEFLVDLYVFAKSTTSIPLLQDEIMTSLDTLNSHPDPKATNLAHLARILKLVAPDCALSRFMISLWAESASESDILSIDAMDLPDEAKAKLATIGWASTKAPPRSTQNRFEAQCSFHVHPTKVLFAEVNGLSYFPKENQPAQPFLQSPKNAKEATGKGKEPAQENDSTQPPKFILKASVNAPSPFTAATQPTTKTGKTGALFPQPTLFSFAPTQSAIPSGPMQSAPKPGLFTIPTQNRERNETGSKPAEHVSKTDQPTPLKAGSENKATHDGAEETESDSLSESFVMADKDKSCPGK